MSELCFFMCRPSEKAQERKETLEQELLMKGPGTFPLERLLAIFQCPPGYYNDLASLFLNTNDDAIRNLFSPRIIKEFHITSLFIYFATIYCLGIITYGIAIPSGLFIPVILAGAAYGRLFGRLFETITKLDRGLFALLGAASFLGGTMRMTVSICVILLELTNDLLLLPLVMLVLLVSKTVFR